MAAALPPVQRIVSMDVLRGIAVLGILLANISVFCAPAMEMQTAWSVLKPSPDEAWAHAVREALVSGKMRAMLALLFGAGLWMQYSKMAAQDQLAAERGDPKKLWPKKYAVRTALLLALGAIHGVFIWFGDILAIYAICAFITIPFVKVSDKVLAWIIGGCLAFGLVVGGGLGALVQSGLSQMGPETPFIGAASEAKIYAQDGYLMQTLHRVIILALNSFNFLFMAPPIFAMFLGGMMLARRGLFRAEGTASSDLSKMLKIGLGIGIPLNLIPIALRFFDLPPYATFAVEFCFAPILAFGLVAFFLKVLPAIPRLLTDPFRRVGKIALTSYLTQSILCTTLCYSWGFRLYGTLDWKEQVLVCLGVWTFCLVFAAFWTSRFSIGPVEWVWRSAIEGRRLPWKEAASRTPALAAADGGASKD